MAKNKSYSEDVDIYKLYLADISKYMAINDTVAREYISTVRNGDVMAKKLAKERLVGSYQRYVISIANKYAKNGNLMDIISEGNIGLMRAIDEFNLDSDVKFTTYAMYWIRKTIMAYITVTEPTVAPNNAFKLATYLPKIKQQFMQENCRQATVEELQELMMDKYNLTFKNKEDLESYKTVSIDETYNVDNEGAEYNENAEYAARTMSCNIDEYMDNYDAKMAVKKILSKLNERDEYIVKCLYGIDCKPKSMDDIADEIGVSHERVRQIAVNSVRKLGEQFKNVKEINQKDN